MLQEHDLELWHWSLLPCYVKNAPEWDIYYIKLIRNSNLCFMSINCTTEAACSIYWVWSNEIGAKTIWEITISSVSFFLFIPTAVHVCQLLSVADCSGIKRGFIVFTTLMAINYTYLYSNWLMHIFYLYCWCFSYCSTAPLHELIRLNDFRIKSRRNC